METETEDERAALRREIAQLRLELQELSKLVKPVVDLIPKVKRFL